MRWTVRQASFPALCEPFPAEGVVAGRPVFAFIARAERTLLLYYAVASLGAVRSVADRCSRAGEVAVLASDVIPCNGDFSLVGAIILPSRDPSCTVFND